MRRGCAIALTASYLAASLPAMAGNPPAAAAAAPTTDKATLIKARQQFQQALALETAGDWAGASSLFEQVAQVRLTPQVRFHIALCEEHLGKLAAALGHYQIAADEAQEAQANEVAAQVASRTEVLKARIPKILIQRGAGADYASVSLDGVVLGGSSVGVDLPVDPGPHTIDATSQGFKPFNLKFQIVEKENKKIEIVMEALPPPPEDKTMSASGETSLPPPSKNLAPFIVGGVGVASLAASGVFFLLRSKSIKSLEDSCPTRTSCPADEKSTYDQGKTYTVVADVTLGIGIAGVAAGATLFLLNHKKAAQPPTAGSVKVVPLLGSSTSGAALIGSF